MSALIHNFEQTTKTINDGHAVSAIKSIQIRVELYKNHKIIKLAILLLKSNQTENQPYQSYEKLISLDKKGKFDLKNLLPKTNMFKSAIENAVLLNIPGLDGAIILQPDGSFILEKLKTACLKISTTGNITTTGLIQAERLALHAKEITFHKEIEASTLIIQANKTLKNYKTIRAVDIKISGSGTFENFGFVNARKKLFFEIRNVNNRGAIIARSLFTSKSQLKIPASNTQQVPLEELTNNGLIVTDNLVCAAYEKLINNKNIISKGTLSIGSPRVINTGNIVAEQEIYLFGDGLNGNIDNFGTLRSAKKINISNTPGFQNCIGGKLVAECIRVQSKKSFINSGLMAATKKLAIGSDKLLINAKTGIIYSDARVKIIGLGLLENLGEITGHKSITTKTAGSTENFSAAKMKGKKIASISKEFFNCGEIAAIQSLDIEALSVYNILGAHMSSNGTTYVNALVSVHNGGKLYASCLSVETRTLVNQMLTGEIISLDDLSLKVHQDLQNLNLIQSEGDVKLSAELLNNLHAGIVASAKTITAQVNKLQNNGIIDAEHRVKLKMVDAENSNRISSRESVSVGATGNFSNICGGAIGAPHLKLKNGALCNQGILQAERELRIEAQYILRNALFGVITSRNKLELFSKQFLENASHINSRGTLLLKADSILKNSSTGTVVAEQDLQLLARHVLSNAGKVFTHKNLLIQSGDLFINEPLGSIRSHGDLSINSDYQAANHGFIISRQAFSIKALEIIRNHEMGILQAEGALRALSQLIANQGRIVSEKTLKLDTSFILDNYITGFIAAEDALELCSACILRNRGLIRGQSITARAELLLQSLYGSQMAAERDLNAFSNALIENAGLLTAERASIQASQLFSNLVGGKLIATQHLATNSSIISNAASIKSYGGFSLQANTLVNLSLGRISANETLKIFVKHYTDNLGLLAGGHTTLESGHMFNSGIIASLNDLSLNIKNTFHQVKFGKMCSEAGVNLLARDLYLAGQMMSQGTFLIEQNQNFEYSPDTLWVCGLLKLIVKAGYNFTHSLQVFGSLEILSSDYNQEIEVPEYSNKMTRKKRRRYFMQLAGEIPDMRLIHLSRATTQNGAIRINTDIQASKTVSINARNLMVETGGIVAGQQLNTDIKNKLQNNKGAYLGSQGGIKAKAAIIQNDGDIHSKLDMVLEALKLMQNTGNIISNGNAHIIAPTIHHARLNEQAPKPVIAAQNLVLKGHTYMYDGLLAVKDNYTILGTFKFYDTEQEKAKAEHNKKLKKMKRRRRLKLIQTVIATLVASYLSPQLCAKLFMGIGKLGIVLGTVGERIVEGMVFGGMSSGFQGKNILRGSLQGGFFAGFNLCMNQLLEGTFKVTSEGLREAIVAASTAGIDTAIHGGNILQNMLLSAGGTAAGRLAVSTFKIDAQRAPQALHRLTSKEMREVVRDAVVQSLVKGGLTSLVCKTSVEETLMATGMAALQSFAGAHGQNARFELITREVGQSAVVNNYQSSTPQNLQRKQSTDRAVPAHYPNNNRGIGVRGANRNGVPSDLRLPVNEALQQFFTPGYTNSTTHRRHTNPGIILDEARPKPQAIRPTNVRNTQPATPIRDTARMPRTETTLSSVKGTSSEPRSPRNTPIAIDILNWLIPAAHADDTVNIINTNNRTAPPNRPIDPPNKLNKVQSKNSILVEVHQPDTSFWETCLIASGRAFAKTAQGVKQLGLEIGESIGLVEPGATRNYTKKINGESDLYYNRTSVGRSALGLGLEAATDIGITFAIPLSASARGMRLIASSMGAGAFFGGIQTTQDGSLGTRLLNAAEGAGFGAVGGAFVTYAMPKAKNALMPLYEASKNRLVNLPENKTFVRSLNIIDPNNKILTAWESYTTRSRVVILSPYNILFSQSSINDVGHLVASMQSQGWKSSAINVVRLKSGELVTLHNTRIFAASVTDTSVKMVIREYSEQIPGFMQRRFKTNKDGVPNSWGEAVEFRINKQCKGYREAYPQGSPFIGINGQVDLMVQVPKEIIKSKITNY